jgi:peroxiredoxin
MGNLEKYQKDSQRSNRKMTQVIRNVKDKKKKHYKTFHKRNLPFPLAIDVEKLP